MIVIPQDLRSKANNLNDFVNEIFPDIKSIANEGMKNVMIDSDNQWMHWLTSRAIICSTNAICQEVNAITIKQLDSRLFVYRSFDVVRDETESHKFPPEYLNSLEPSGVPYHIIEVRNGTSIMLIRNLDPVNGHVNGARLQYIHVEGQ